MILQQLYADADAIMKQTGRGTLPPAMYMRKPVRWIIELSRDLRLPVQFQSTPGDDKKGRGVERVVPFVKRAGTVIRPVLFADKTSFTLGVRVANAKLDAGRDSERDTQRTRDEHDAYKKLVRACADATQNADVIRIADFLEVWNPDAPETPLPEAMGRDDLWTFRVDNKDLPIENEAVQRFWAEAVSRGIGTESGEGLEETAEEADAIADGAEVAGPKEAAMFGVQGQCLVSGQIGATVEMMPVPVKGLPGGKSEMAIVSGNSSAFESYGLKRAQTSPISQESGERFGQALNALLASKKHHVRGGSVTYVYWARGGTVPLPAFGLPEEKQDPKVMREFLTAAHAGDTKWVRIVSDDEDESDWDDKEDETRNENQPERREYHKRSEQFHLFGLTPNAARVVVRSALDTSIKEIGRAQAEWFDRLQIVGGESKYPKLSTLAVAAYREFKDVPPSVDDALVLAALRGASMKAYLPQTLLTALVSRCRLDTDNRVTYPRAALIKYIITQEWPLEEAKKMETEVTGDLPEKAGDGVKPAAYHCGRLFAELEEIQKQAIPGIKATISDRFFGSASSSPASVFGTLLSGAQNHLSKLRKEREGAFYGATRRMEEILAEIEDFPHLLPLRDQAFFSLGYYHHRAAQRKDIAERSAAKKNAALSTGLNTDDANTAKAAKGSESGDLFRSTDETINETTGDENQ